MHATAPAAAMPWEGQLNACECLTLRLLRGGVRSLSGLPDGCALSANAPLDFLQRLFCAACGVAVEPEGGTGAGR